MSIPHPIIAETMVLRPFRGLIEPAWWEDNLYYLSAITILTILLGVIRYHHLKRSTPLYSISPLIIIREELVKLQNQKLTPENLAQISHHFHRYLLWKLETKDELTSKECLDRIKGISLLQSQILPSIDRLLSLMEAMKFADSQSTTLSDDLATQALSILDAWQKAEEIERSAKIQIS